MPDKRTARVTIWMPESLEVELMRRASEEDRKFSDFITHILMVHAYGHFRTAAAPVDVANSGDERA